MIVQVSQETRGYEHMIFGRYRSTWSIVICSEIPWNTQASESRHSSTCRKACEHGQRTCYWAWLGCKACILFRKQMHGMHVVCRSSEAECAECALKRVLSLEAASICSLPKSKLQQCIRKEHQQIIHNQNPGRCRLVRGSPSQK